ncbi:MAG: PQQ-like beta-propeller repeat protein [Acidobacteria bacterium]|nr:PQQ-like beta-propeller repeat protein [Acidobacteriota bacterium]
MKLAWIHAVVFASMAWCGNWPQFRGAMAAGLGDGTPPAGWDGESGKNVLWKTAIPGLGHSSPVIWEERIFVTSAVPASGGAALKVGLYGDVKPVEGEGEQSFVVYCLNRKTGKVLWKQTAAGGVPKIKRHPKSTHANPTPATDGKHLVVSFGSEGLYAYDLEGKPLWKKDLGILDAGFYLAPNAQWGYASSPVIHRGRVIVLADVQKDSFLAAFDAKTGKELWRTPRKDVPTFGTPGIAPRPEGGWQVVVNGWKHIGGYDPATGKELWRLTGGGDIPTPTPVYSEGMVVVTNAHGSSRPIYAIRAGAKGDLSVDRSGIAWQQDRAGNYTQTPLLHEGLGYFCFDNGVLSVYQLADGQRVYQQRLGAGLSGFSSSPVAAAGRLYITNEEGHTYVLALGREYKPVGEAELGETVMATPAVADSVIYMRGRSHVWALGVK